MSWDILHWLLASLTFKLSYMSLFNLHNYWFLFLEDNPTIAPFRKIINTYHKKSLPSVFYSSVMLVKMWVFSIAIESHWVLSTKVQPMNNSICLEKDKCYIYIYMCVYICIYIHIYIYIKAHQTINRKSWTQYQAQGF